MAENSTATWQDFEKIDMRVGKIVAVTDFPEAKIPAYRLNVDLGPDIGVKKSSARITELYGRDELVGKKVVCVVNFAPKKVGPFRSEVLVMGAYSQGGVVLLKPELDRAEPGDKIG
ncbi:MAG: tRNA-binding protein [Candidatus Micrarchaeota archaeon]|nr:tRNA-binding protein [Candidatus Micrarchaeota archaeon]